MSKAKETKHLIVGLDIGTSKIAAIVAEVKTKDYSAQALVESIVLSTPFRQKERPKEKKIL